MQASFLSSLRGGKGRSIDPETEGQYIERVKDLRSKCTSDLKRSGNVAVADVNIDGIAKNEYSAHSGIDEIPSNFSGELGNLSTKPSNPVYYAIEAPNAKGELYLRDGCTEYKIMNEIANQLRGNH